MILLKKIKCAIKGKHQWSEWTPLVSNKSKDICKQKRECKICRIEELKHAPHNWEDWTEITPCLQKRKCHFCHVEDFNRHNHEWNQWKSKNLCESERLCQKCNKHEKKVKEENHDWEYVGGYKKCKNCDKQVYVGEYTSSCNHEFEDYYEDDGQGVSGGDRCIKCGHTENEWSAQHDFL